jgi:two-component system, OmpR family, sensor histidine kinase MtrB
VKRAIWRSLGLRARVAVAFGLGAFALSVVLATATYGLTREYITNQRESTTLRQATFNARVVGDALRAPSPALPALLERLDASAGEASSPLVYASESWYDGQYPPGHERLPDGLVEQVLAGASVQRRSETPTGPELIVGVPIGDVSGAYFEVFRLTDQDQTLQTLATILVATGTVTTVLGLGLGMWFSRRAVRPLVAVNAAAAAFARGDHSARIEPAQDPDLQALAESFNQTAAALQRRVERDARFAANVSHELRTPITTMVNAVQLLVDRRDELPAQDQETVDLLAGDVRRFARMVEDLLEISSVEAAGRRLSLEPVRIGALVELAANSVAGRAVTEIASDAAHLVVQADKRRLERVISNLVENAEIHGGGVRRVLVDRVDEQARIVVEDAGPGVPAAEREHVFERFGRGPRDRRGHDQQAAGVGLGLALAAEHVRLHGGHISVADRAGGGARFMVDLPIEDDGL